MKETSEKLTAEAILETPITVCVGDVKYQVAPPTLATLIEVSKYISQLPESIKNVEDSEDVLKETLSVAFASGYIGDILAILILGSKGIKVTYKAITIKKFGFIPIKKEIRIDPQAKLSEKILDELSPKQAFELTADLLNKLDVAFFLSTIIFLKNVNILRKTKF